MDSASYDPSKYDLIQDNSEIGTTETSQERTSPLGWIPPVGAVLGGTIAGIPTGGVGAAPGAAAGYGGGYVIKDLLDSFLGYKKKATNKEEVKQQSGEDLSKGVTGVASAAVLANTLASLTQFLFPKQTLGKYQQELAKESDKKISGNEIVKKMEEWTQSPQVPVTGYNKAQNLLTQTESKYGGKELSIPDLLSAKATEWSQGYNLKGAGKPTSAAFSRATGSALQEELKKSVLGGTFNEKLIPILDKAQSGIYTAKTGLGNVGSTIQKVAYPLLAWMAVKKYLGL
jgi:hypothetical protein